MQVALLIALFVTYLLSVYLPLRTLDTHVKSLDKRLERLEELAGDEGDV